MWTFNLLSLKLWNIKWMQDEAHYSEETNFKIIPELLFTCHCPSFRQCSYLYLSKMNIRVYVIPTIRKMEHYKNFWNLKMSLKKFLKKIWRLSGQRKAWHWQEQDEMTDPRTSYPRWRHGWPDLDMMQRHLQLAGI